MAKPFKPLPEPLRKLASENGGCIASREITVDGAQVGFMTRDATDRPGDTGWSFFSGDESRAYMDNAKNFDVWHINEIANYDPAIVPYLFALPGQKFLRDGDDFAEAPDSSPDDSALAMPAGVRVVQGRFELDAVWSLELATPFRKRIEDGSVVLWRPGLTLWINKFKNNGSSIATRADQLRERISPTATDVRFADAASVARLTYRLREDTTNAGLPSLYALVITDSGHVQFGVYIDRESDVLAAYAIVASCSCA